MDEGTVGKLRSSLPASLLIVIPLKQNNIRRPKRVIRSLMRKLGENLITAGTLYDSSGEVWAIQLYVVCEKDDVKSFKLLEREVLRKYKDVGAVVLDYVEYIGLS